MIILLYFLIFIIGASVGSFLGVIVDRLNSKEPIWEGRSHCDHCRHKLHTKDLFPLVSFFILKRKCRYCHEKLSWFYPFVELITAVSYVIAFYTVFHFSAVLLMKGSYYLLVLYYFLLISSLIVIFFADIRYGIIPFKIIAFALAVTLIWDITLHFIPFTMLEAQIFSLQPNFLTVLLSALGTGGFFLLIFLLTRGRGMGFGDVVYALMMGLILGFPNVILGLYIAFVTGAIVSIVLVALKKKQFRGGTIPFGPFLVLGTVVGLLWGNSIITFLLSYITG